ncbi:hypothetical protein PV05_05240 [Exophiala xenobiotica]|uniref:Uncharacterized protein n=1 Tax=Exophiala xenobiotica TaxID=348802 RepID=A0A0D2BVU0_9EURO|nr:uncharacterized protein PV05_05240 [Exophiala xenobiotica]KIW56591.1 hypothetical protein PV05_05240 [Exophiala xenobiotica]
MLCRVHAYSSQLWRAHKPTCTRYLETRPESDPRDEFSSSPQHQREPTAARVSRCQSTSRSIRVSRTGTLQMAVNRVSARTRQCFRKFCCFWNAVCRPERTLGQLTP